jgi:hypothetical protein
MISRLLPYVVAMEINARVYVRVAGAYHVWAFFSIAESSSFELRCCWANLVVELL